MIGDERGELRVTGLECRVERRREESLRGEVASILSEVGDESVRQATRWESRGDRAELGTVHPPRGVLAPFLATRQIRSGTRATLNSVLRRCRFRKKAQTFMENVHRARH